MVSIDKGEITAHQSECQLPLGDVLQLLDELVNSCHHFVTKTAPRTLGDFTLWISLLQRPKTKTRDEHGPGGPLGPAQCGPGRAVVWQPALLNIFATMVW